MALFRRAVGEYWIAYYLCYVAIAVLGWWLNRERLQWSQLLREDQVYLAAAILGAAAGIALLAAIILEGDGSYGFVNSQSVEPRQKRRARRAT